MRRIVLTGAAALALVAGGTAAGAAIAAGPIDGSGVIHGCYYPPNAHGSSRIVLQDTTTSCPAAAMPITWNQTGPQGPQGPQGAQGSAGAAGPQGAAGPAGANGANGNTILSGTGAPAASAGQDGDFYIDTAADVLYGPKAGGAWPATGTSLVGLAGPAGATGSTGPAGPPGVGTAGSGGLDVTVVENVANLAPGAIDEVSVQCPAAEPFVLGGGGTWFAAGFENPGAGGPYITGSIPINNGVGGEDGQEVSDGGWRVFAVNNEPAGSGLDQLQVWAICAA